MGHNQTQVAMRNIHWTFPWDHIHPVIETSSRGSYNSPDLTLIFLLFLKKFFLSRGFLKYTSNTWFEHFSANIYLFKANNRNTKKRCEICSKLIIKTPERRQRCRSGVFIVKFEHISHIFLVFLLFTLNK